MSQRPPFLILALGNELLGDDGIALFAARQLKQVLDPQYFDVIESGEAGLALMELMTGYQKSLLMDSVQTGQVEAGSILQFEVEDFRRVIAPSPHYAGIPEVLDMAKRLGIDFPTEIKTLACEVVNPFDFQEKLSPEVEAGLPKLVQAARAILEPWRKEALCTNTP